MRAILHVVDAMFYHAYASADQLVALADAPHALPNWLAVYHALQLESICSNDNVVAKQIHSPQQSRKCCLCSAGTGEIVCTTV